MNDDDDQPPRSSLAPTGDMPAYMGRAHRKPRQLAGYPAVRARSGAVAA
jgi:hypothetical protein